MFSFLHTIIIMTPETGANPLLMSNNGLNLEISPKLYKLSKRTSECSYKTVTIGIRHRGLHLVSILCTVT